MPPETHPIGLSNMPITGWKVTGQVETTDLGPDGRPTPGVRITFQTAEGVGSSIFVPAALYNPANVRAMIAAKAAQVDEIHRLQG